RELAERRGATLYMAVVAGLGALLQRYTDQDDLLVGTVAAGRQRPELEGLIGFFVNTLVLRLDLSGDPDTHGLLHRIREMMLASDAHQDLPFEELVKVLDPSRDLSHNPFFSVMLSFQNLPPAGAAAPAGVSLERFRFRKQAVQFDLHFDLTDGPQGLAGSLGYRTALFESATVRRLARAFEAVLAGMARQPGLPLSELPLLTEAESLQLVTTWNRPATSGIETTLDRLFAAAVANSPRALALSCAGQQLTYRELDERSNRLARRLRLLGVGPETRVGLRVERSAEMLVGILGILKAGGAYVPLEPSLPAERLAFLLADSGVRLLLTEAEILDPDVAAEAPTPLAPSARPDNAAYVIYTSGSTGRPKGVVVTHANVARLLARTEPWFGFGPDDVWTLFHSYAFDFSVWEIWGALAYGGRLIVVPWEVSRSPEVFLDLLAEERVTVLNQTPSAFRLLSHAEETGVPREVSLRWVIFGGEALELPSLAPWLARHGDERPRLVNMYGITETTVHVTFRRITGADLAAAHGSVIGEPIPDLQVHVLDRQLRPVPLTAPGEICVGGPGLARGYLGRPELTAGRFVPDPWGALFGRTGARLYRSGDLARRRTDGDLEYLGRRDQQVKVRGFRIELREIEARLVALAGVREAVVLAREDTPRDRRLVAYVVGDAAVEALRQALRELLPEYMVPAAFVTLTALPLTPNGKVDRKALPAPEWQSAEESYRAPRTPFEEVLAGIWAELLKLDRVGTADHFFDLGGHSLLATQVMSRLRGVFGVEMPLRALFEAPMLADLAVRVEETLRAGQGQLAPPLVPVPRERDLPLSFAQQRLWFIDQLEPGTPLYNIPVTLRVAGPLDPAVLALCLGEIVRRHEALRTVFAAPEGSSVQVIRAPFPFELAMVDLSELPESRRETLASALAGEEASRPFDLARGPLLRGALLRLGGEDHLAALTMHHIASDGWSMDILVREVTALYAAFFEGRPSPLPELPVQYADFAAWQRSWLHGEVLESEIAFWRQQLAGLPPRLELSTDRPRPAVQSFRGASRPVHLPAELSRQAQVQGRREGATLFMVLLAGFQALLARYSAQNDLAVGTPVAGRNRVEIENLIGFFVNTLVLRGDLSGEPSFRELLGRVRETALAAHTHQDVPFERLVQELTPERSLAHTPLFQAMFALQNAPVERLAIRDLRLRPAGGAGTTAKFDLTLSLQEWSGGLSGAIEYATDLFDAATIDRLIGHFERLFAVSIATPDVPILGFSLLNAAERSQILLEWNDTQEASAPRDCLHELFEAQVRRTPEAVALVAGERELRYAELDQAANRLAGHLRRRGVGPEVVVGVCLERSADMVAALLAILKAGAAYLPLDLQLPRLRLAGMLTSARVSHVVSRQSLAAELPWSGAPILVDQDLDQEMEEARHGSGNPGAVPGNLAYVLYTSGSTGAPKGVAVTHRSVVELVRWAGTVYSPEDLAGVLAATSLSFDLSVFELFIPLCWGGTVILAQNVLELPKLLSSGPASGRVTLVNTVPSAMAELVNAGNLGASIRIVNLAGEPLQRPLVERIYAAGAIEHVWNLYGPSEDTTYST
ncbi:MAG TPA: amino acid adenylation domain-containing protein, partial [Thermoanaerobaculia bacterium]|nr:amino acid adenylation domain-containing protein [Thermoanaerobaculia bacterium]